DLRLAVTAADAAADTYEIPVEAGGAYVTAKFHVRRPKLDLAFRVIDDDPKTLAKTVEIHNNGDTLTDLAVHVTKENEGDLGLEPSINHLRVTSQASIRITATPVLYLEFESLSAQMEAKAAGQTTKFPLDFKAPAGMRLIAFRSASTDSTNEDDHYCTNKPTTCSTASGPAGNGPAPSIPDPPVGQPAQCEPCKPDKGKLCSALAAADRLAHEMTNWGLHTPTSDEWNGMIASSKPGLLQALSDAMK